MRPSYLTNHRKDASESSIVKSLRKCGYTVWDRLPDDVLVWHPKYGQNWFRVLSIKTPDAQGRVRRRNDQEKQDAFVELTGVPRVTNEEQALEAVET